MLVLTRKQNEKICIGENITITVIRMKGKSVRLGIEAPSNVNVLRGELVVDPKHDSASIHCETSALETTVHTGEATAMHEGSLADDTIIECRIPRSQHQDLVLWPSGASSHQVS